MATITARIPDLLNNDLEKLSHFQDRSKSNVIKRAIEKYVVEMLEDIEDVIDAERVSAQNNKAISIEELAKDLGINLEELGKEDEKMAS